MKDNSITIAKAFGIIMMVIGHCGVPHVTKYIYMFHMPLFFLLSGYCFKEAHLLDFRHFAWKRIKGLYFPFVKYGLLFLLLHNVFFHLNIYSDQYGWGTNVSHLYTLKETILSAVFGTLLFATSEPLLGGYWFLSQLFYASIFGWILLKLFHKQSLLGGAMCLIVSAMFKYFDLNIPYTSISGLTFMATAFFIFGYSIKQYRIATKGWQGLVCSALVYIGTFFWRSELPNCTIVKMLPYTLTAILGSLMTMQLSRWVNDLQQSQIGNRMREVLVFTGEHTLEILTWHFLCFKSVSLIVILIEGHPIEMLGTFPCIGDPHNSLWWIAYTTIGICLPLFVVWGKEKIKQIIRVSS